MSKSLSRQEKLDSILGEKYPREFSGRETIKSILSVKPILGHYPKNTYKIAGRISARRDHGNNIFFDIFDQTGTVQLHAKTGKDSNEKEMSLFNRVWECDLGDMVGVSGTLGENPRGEVLFQITDWTLLAKALREPGDKFHGINDPEVKYRHRELDLLSSADSRAIFQKRAEIVFEIRKYLNDRDFIEIECPILQPIYGGATARPFKTRHNALGQDFFLSISSELYLKRAMVGGFDRVYSFSRCFRNEGISPTHNPEFTNLEIFASCKTSIDMKDFVLDLLNHIKYEYTSATNQFDYELKSNFPAADWPLSRKYTEPMNDILKEEGRTANQYADAWELFINGMEIASGATDLNDPCEQAYRFNRSWENKNMNDNEYDPFDSNYIEALEQGALPWAGVGIGIDRLCMLLLGKTNIRDVVIFPTLKNQS